MDFPYISNSIKNLFKTRKYQEKIIQITKKKKRKKKKWKSDHPLLLGFLGLLSPLHL